MKEQTFIKITNKQIYEKLVCIEKQIMKTNGKVTLNRWIATTALSLVTILIFAIFGVKI